MGLGSGGFRSNVQVVGGWLFKFLNLNDDEDSPSGGVWNDGSWVGPVRDNGGQVFNVKNPRFGDGGAKGDGVTDDTAAIQAALIAAQAGDIVYLPRPSVRYLVSDTLTIAGSGVTIMGAGWSTEVRINVQDKPVFQATDVDNLRFENFAIYGGGTWSSGWTGNQANLDRGINLIRCDGCTLENLWLRNHGNTAICLRGGVSNKILFCKIEGTHAYGTTLSSNDNFQNGIMLQTTQAGEEWDDVLIQGCEIEGTAQGILTEAAAFTEGSVQIKDINIHDIPGQHGLYLQHGRVSVTGRIRDTALAGLKIQSSTTVAISDVRADVEIQDTGSQAVELSVLGTGSIKRFDIKAVVYNVQRAASITGEVSQGRLEVVGDTITQHGVLIQDGTATDIDIYARLSNIQRYGIIINTDATPTGLRLYPVLRECGQETTTTYDGIYIGGAAVNTEIRSPEITDSNSKMRYGIFVESSSATGTKVLGSCKISGYASQAVRAVGTITEFPENADVGTLAANAYTDQSTVRSSGAVRRGARSTSASAVPLWIETLSDEGAYIVRAEIVGKLSGSAERAGYVSTAVFYRDGGNATLQGSADEDVAVASASFGGAYAWAVSGNTARLNVNSGGSATYDWTARVTVTRVVG